MIIKLANKLFLMVLGGLITLASLLYLYHQQQPDLSLWHTTPLSEEYNQHTPVRTFDEYLTLENKLFAEVNEKIIQKFPSVANDSLNRFDPNSQASPNRFSQNWNKSFELFRESPKAGILLLHGLGDSPYNLRTLGQTLHRYNAYVVGLRLPGHGTAPSALNQISLQDIQSVIRIAMTHLKEKVGDQPIYMIGDSSGATLALLHALNTLKEQDAVPIEGIVMISPNITPPALTKYATLQMQAGNGYGMEKFAWLKVLPEYNPFQYQSLPINAPLMTHALNHTLLSILQSLDKTTLLEKLPPLITFQSAVDDCVPMTAMIDFYQHFNHPRHRLVLFDINRHHKISILAPFLSQEAALALLKDPTQHFQKAFITNLNEKTPEVIEWSWEKENAMWQKNELELYWPDAVYSLSHIALPIHPEDEIYGNNGNTEIFEIGGLAFYGERNILTVPAQEILRLKWNPFYRYLEDHILSFTGLTY